MDHFPIFVAAKDRSFMLSGGGEAAMAKLRLLLKSTAHIHVFSQDPAPEITAWAKAGKLTLHSREIVNHDTTNATLIYAADEDATRDARTAQLAKDAGVLCNIVDNLSDSAFITPAIVDRDPVTVAIGTEGAAPVLARAIKADLEARLPTTLGLRARVGKGFRKMADTLPFGRARRDFWRDYYFGQDIQDEATAQDTLNQLLLQHQDKTARPGHVHFVGGGPGDPELLTLKARRVLDEADVVIYDRLITPEILELARREALMIDVGKEGFGPSTSQETINDLLVLHSATGAQVVRLKSGDATIFGRLDEEIDALDATGASWSIVPGITSASAAVAGIGQSLTKRGRNSSVRFLTGHDMRGFADHDWRVVAQPGEVSAVYMGKKSARFIQGRLLMHGADRQMPVTLVENASRSNQRVLETTLDALPAALDVAQLNGPAITFLGLAPRQTVAVTPSLQEAFA